MCVQCMLWWLLLAAGEHVTNMICSSCFRPSHWSSFGAHCSYSPACSLAAPFGRNGRNWPLVSRSPAAPNRREQVGAARSRLSGPNECQKRAKKAPATSPKDNQRQWATSRPDRAEVGPAASLFGRPLSVAERWQLAGCCGSLAQPPHLLSSPLSFPPVGCSLLASRQIFSRC